MLSRPEQKLTETSIVHSDSDCKPSDPLLGVDYSGLLGFLQIFEELTPRSRLVNRLSEEAQRSLNLRQTDETNLKIPPRTLPERHLGSCIQTRMKSPRLGNSAVFASRL